MWNRKSSSYSVFTNTAMAAKEVIELDSGSSDDEYEKPPRVPIGWNYQSSSKSGCVGLRYGSIARPLQKDRANGQVSNKSVQDDDDLEIVEVTTKVSPQSKLPKGTVMTPLPASSTRAEIRHKTRNTTQASISSFFKKQPSPDVKRNGKNESRRRNVEDDKKTKVTENVRIDESNKSTKQEPNKKSEEESRKEPVKQNGTKEDDDEENSETSIAALENFVSRWEDIKSGPEDQKIREKLWKYYYLAHSSYIHSKKFITLVESSTRKITVDNIYVIIKDLLDSLKRYKDLPYGEKKKGVSEEQPPEGSGDEPAVELTEEEKKRNSRLRKVEKKMKEISDKIKELENMEVDLDDEDNSTYLIEERLKRQFTKLHDYYCRLAQCSSATGRPIERKFRYDGSRYPEINKRISAWVNKNKEFPDYVDVLNLVKKVIKQRSLPWRPETIRVQAQEIFRDVGMMLKERRESDDLYSIYSYADEDVPDPAANDEELNNKLTENEAKAKEKLDKIFQDYVDKEACARETADKKATKVKSEDNADQVGTDSEKINVKTEESGTEKIDSIKEEKVKTEHNISEGVDHDGVEGEKEHAEEEGGDVDDDGDDVDDDGGDVDDDGEDDDDDDDDEEEDDDEEDGEEEDEDEGELEETERPHYAQDDDDDGDITDDDLNNVLASACMEADEPEDSEEDVPIMDDDEVVYKDIAEEDNEEVICLDDTDDNENTDHITENVPSLESSSLSEKRKNSDDSSSPHKKQCMEQP